MVRRVWWVLVVVASILGSCHRVRPPLPPLELPVAWQVGDRLSLEVAKERTGIQDWQRKPMGRGVFPVEVEIASRTGDTYVLLWTYGAAKLEGGPTLKEPMATFMKRLTTILDGKRLVIRVKPLQGQTEIVNLDDVTQWYQEGFEEARRALIEGGVPGADAERLMGPVTVLGRPENVAPSALEQPRLLLRFVGARLTPGEVVEYEDRLPLEPGGEPIPTKGRYVLEKVDAGKQEAHIAWRQHVDEDAARASVLAMVRKMAERAGTRPPQPSEVPPITIEDDGRWVMSTVTGWPVAVSFARTSISGEIGRIETTTMVVRQGAPPAP